MCAVTIGTMADPSSAEKFQRWMNATDVFITPVLVLLWIGAAIRQDGASRILLIAFAVFGVGVWIGQLARFRRQRRKGVQR
jgi:hypothetical protein